MKIYALTVLQAKPNEESVVLANSQDLSSFSFYQRGTVGEFLTFFTKTIVDRTAQDQRQSVAENNYVFYVYNRGGNEQLAAVLVADSEYPQRPAFSVLTKVLETFITKVPESYYSNPASINFPELKGFLDQYQDPSKADTIMKLQQELDDTKIILNKTIDSVLARGEKLENLVERSDALNASSKRFYKTAKAQNSCCVIM